MVRFGADSIVNDSMKRYFTSFKQILLIHDENGCGGTNIASSGVRNIISISSVSIACHCRMRGREEGKNFCGRERLRADHHRGQ